MGRHDYLTRLALGRSAFQDLEPQPAAADAQLTTGTSNALDPPPVPSQHYDAKGRPTNAVADKLNADIRHAQNEVLELVNVVERRQCSYAAEANARSLRESHLKKLKEASDNLDDVFDDALVALTWYPGALLHRYLCGVYDTTAPFAQVMAADLSSVITGDWDNAEGVLFPGMVYMGLATLHIALPDIADLCALLIELSRGRRPKQQTTASTTRRVCQAVALAAHACLIPMQYIAVAAKLGLIRPTGTKASLRMLASFYSACCTSSGTAIIIAATGAHYLAKRYASARLLDIAAMPASFIWHHAAFSQRRKVLLPSGVEIAGAEKTSTVETRRLPVRELAWSNMLHNATTRLMHLPIEVLALQMSVRVFDFVVFGIPRKMHGAASLPRRPALPLIGLLDLRAMNTGASLQAMSKIGLALGISLGIDAALRCVFIAWKQRCIIDFSDEPAGK